MPLFANPQVPWAEVVRKVDLGNANTVSILAGDGSYAWKDAANGLSARFQNPLALALTFDSSTLLVGVSVSNVFQKAKRKNSHPSHLFKATKKGPTESMAVWNVM